MAKWAEKPWWEGQTNAAMNYDVNQFSLQTAMPYLNAPPAINLTYARNAEGGLSFFANGIPVGAIANCDLIRLIQQAAECLQAK